jgi:hypothetical protein
MMAMDNLALIGATLAGSADLTCGAWNVICFLVRSSSARHARTWYANLEVAVLNLNNLLIDGGQWSCTVWHLA